MGALKGQCTCFTPAPAPTQAHLLYTAATSQHLSYCACNTITTVDIINYGSTLGCKPEALNLQIEHDIPALSAAGKACTPVLGLQCVVCASDSSLDRVLALISKAALLGVDQQRLAQAQQACVSRNMSAASALKAALHASPFSMDIFRLRLLDAKRLGLSHEVESSQGECKHQTISRNCQSHACNGTESPRLPGTVPVLILRIGSPASPIHVACTTACSA